MLKLELTIVDVLKTVPEINPVFGHNKYQSFEDTSVVISNTRWVSKL